MSTHDDHYFMGLAMQLAHKGRCTTMPNPAVGCVIVNNGEVIGQGWHEFAGGPHAEVNALASLDAGEDAAGATVYVTLEPCCHEGRTAPCTTALLDAGVARVVAAMQDPNPKVAGKGMEILQQAGVETFWGIMQQQAEELNRKYCHRMKHGRPYVTAKIAMSLDGATAMASGESKWITSADARNDVQAIRRCSSAIMTGSGTVLQDDPSLTVRNTDGDDEEKQPVRVIVDSRAKITSKSKIINTPGEKLVFTAAAGNDDNDADQGLGQCAGVTLMPTTLVDGKLDLEQVMQQLAGLEINDVLLECGETLNGAMLQRGLINELVIYMAPKIMGNNTKGLFSLPVLHKMRDTIDLEITDIRAVGQDWRITAKIIIRD